MIASRHPRPASPSCFYDENLAPARPEGRRVTPLVSHPYKCPLPQTLSFDILTNARGCGGYARSLALFCRSLLQERFTIPLSSTASTLFLKTAGVWGAGHFPRSEPLGVSPSNSHSGTGPAISSLGSSPHSPSVLQMFSASSTPQPSNPQTFQRSSSPPVDFQRVASHNSPSALSTTMAPIIEEGE